MKDGSDHYVLYEGIARVFSLPTMETKASSPRTRLTNRKTCGSVSSILCVVMLAG